MEYLRKIVEHYYVNIPFFRDTFLFKYVVLHSKHRYISDIWLLRWLSPIALKLKVVILPVRVVWYCRQPVGGLKHTSLHHKLFFAFFKFESSLLTRLSLRTLSA